MSRTRAFSALAAGLGILAVACWLVTATFPLAAAPQTVANFRGDCRYRRRRAAPTPVQYPDAARAKNVQGVVTVEAMLDGSGNVIETRVLNGPNELRRAAQQAVLQWHFAMDSSANTRQVKIAFQLPAGQAVNQPATIPGASRARSSQNRRRPGETSPAGGAGQSGGATPGHAGPGRARTGRRQVKGSAE